MYKYVSTFTVEHEKVITIEEPIMSNTLRGIIDDSLKEVLSYYEVFDSIEEFKEALIPIIHTHYCNECSVNNIVFQVYLFNFNNQLQETLYKDEIINFINEHIDYFYKRQKEYVQ